ncbi:MAG: hypothetical protein H6715_02580 [Myxococcales bacterium]|nr:hypothetical protein [Myxococcales bacterium]
MQGADCGDIPEGYWDSSRRADRALPGVATKARAKQPKGSESTHIDEETRKQLCADMVTGDKRDSNARGSMLLSAAVDRYFTQSQAQVRPVDGALLSATDHICRVVCYRMAADALRYADINNATVHGAGDRADGS